MEIISIDINRALIGHRSRTITHRNAHHGDLGHDLSIDCASRELEALRCDILCVIIRANNMNVAYNI